MKNQQDDKYDGSIGRNVHSIIDLKKYRDDGVCGNNAIKLRSWDAEVAVGLNCDIIDLDERRELVINNNSRNNNINKEEMYMKKSIMYDVLKEQLKFLMTAAAFIILSLVGIIVFIRTGKYLIHPSLYIITLLMGIGWGVTAILSIKGNNRM